MAKVSEEEIGDATPVVVQPIATAPVLVLARERHASLVQYEWDGKLYRCHLPNSELAETIPLPTLEMGVPYGIQWEHELNEPQLADLLRRSGVWTWLDVQQRHYTIERKLQAAFGREESVSLLQQIDHAATEAQRREVNK